MIKLFVYLKTYVQFKTFFMKKQLLLTFIFFLSLNAFAQVKFEKGYFIDEFNNKVDCLIKNHDWISAPNEIEYQLSNDNKIEVMSFEKMSSFQIYNTSHYYIKSLVAIDKNSTSEGFNPKIQNIILKVLIDGEASLYSYSDFYFYKSNGGNIKQLLYKKFVTADYKLQEDNAYQRELYTYLNCGQNITEIRKLKYKKKNFIGFFKNYNECKSLPYSVFSDKETKFAYNFNAIGGITFSKGTFEVTRRISIPSTVDLLKIVQDAESDNISTSFMIGMEAEILLPYKKNKLALFMAPNFQKQKFEMSSVYKNGFIKLYAETNYFYFSLPVGLRYYFDLKNSSKIFIDASANAMFMIDVEEITSSTGNSQPTVISQGDLVYDKISTGICLGLGYKFNDKYSISGIFYPYKSLSNTRVLEFGIKGSYKLF